MVFVFMSGLLAVSYTHLDVYKRQNYHYYIFSKSGFTDGLLQAQERGEVQLLTLADIFE